MTRKNPDDSVREEQFGAKNTAAETEETNQNEIIQKITPSEDDLKEEQELDKAAEEEESKKDEEAPEETGKIEEPPETGEIKDDVVPPAGQTNAEESESSEVYPAEDDTKPGDEAPGEEKSIPEADTVAASEKNEDDSAEEKVTENIDLPPVDYSGYSKHDLIETLVLIVENRPPAEIKDDVERIKVLLYKKFKQAADEEKKKFLDEGGKLEEYKSWVDPDEARVKYLIEKYKEKRIDYSKIQEAEKYDNLKKKYEIIDQIKDLVNREESINKTFHDFRSLQNEWHQIGAVPQSSLKELWQNYHHSVEIFYDYIKINKELRDLDLKKNLESKVLLCEKAEELLLEPNAVNAFRLLQDFHNQWREIGPVPIESKNDIWDRFKEATAQINKRHHEYFEKQKDEQRKNLEAKIAICEEVEAINLLEMNNFKDFDNNAEKVVELQKIWRTIGFAPKKQNNKVYQRFREACDTFFEKKRSFYADNKGIQLNNLQLKNDLCVQAEALQESTDWKATSDALIKLQKEWKEIGPVPRKQSEKSWKRFRKACDYFFNKKAEFFSELDTSYEDNLKAKLAIIDELEKFEPGADVHAAFETLKDIQKRWTDVGFVPFNMKDEISTRYRNALNKEFDKLKIGDDDKNILKYKTKLDSLKTNPKASRKVRNERDKFYTKIKQLESDIVLWENNIGFFAKSANADTMIREVQEKIENARKMIKTLEEKVRIIDQSGLDD